MAHINSNAITNSLMRDTAELLLPTIFSAVTVAITISLLN